MTDTAAEQTGFIDYYVAVDGNDAWSGLLPEPAADGSDGPKATMAGARDALRAAKFGAGPRPANVWMRGGRYRVERPVVFTPDDSGFAVYRAYPGERPIVDGGRRIDGWRVETLERPSVSAGGGRLDVWVADLPEVAAGRWFFKQLFAGGERRTRARLPKTGFYWMRDVPDIDLEPKDDFVKELFSGTSRFVAAPGDIRPWRNLADIDVIVPHYWIDERMPIASFDEGTGLVVSSRRALFALRDDIARRFAKYYVEHVFEALSEPGEWYLDRAEGRLYYVPYPDEHPATTEIFAPVADTLICLEGEPESGRYVEYLHFAELEFAHAEWHQPADCRRWFDFVPTERTAAAPQAAVHVPGAIRMRGARFCAIERCAIRHVGGYGIELSDGCSRVRLTANELADLGAGGVKVDGSSAEGPLHSRTAHNTVTDNHIHHGTLVYHNAAGILLTHAADNVIAHNHIHHFHYSGISCGWVWGYGANATRGNKLLFNRIHDLGFGLLSDMGGIYTLGVQPGTEIRGNVIHDIRKANYGGWGIYLDEGSSGIAVEDNICWNTSSQSFTLHYGKENVVRNNVFAFGGEGLVSIGRHEPHAGFTLEGNILLTDGGPVFVSGHLRKRPFVSDRNVIWDIGGKAPHHGKSKFGEQAEWSLVDALSMEEWRGLGQDEFSLIADPDMAEARRGNFAPGPRSAARQIGFRPIDAAAAGPRQRR